MSASRKVNCRMQPQVCDLPPDCIRQILIASWGPSGCGCVRGMRTKDVMNVAANLCRNNSKKQLRPSSKIRERLEWWTNEGRQFGTAANYRFLASLGMTIHEMW